MKTTTRIRSLLTAALCAAAMLAATAIHAGTWVYNSATKTLTHDTTPWVLNVTASGTQLTITSVQTPPTSLSALPLGDAVSGGYTITAIANASQSSTSGVFYGSSTSDPGYYIQSLTLPATLKTIGSSAFHFCGRLTGSLTIPNSVTRIGEYAFRACGGLTGTLTIGDSVTSIDDNAFAGCRGMTAISVSAGHPMYKSVDGVLFNKAMTTLLLYPLGRAGTYTIPDGVTSIGVAAFRDGSGLTSVTIPNGVTSIGKDAFYGNPLTSVTIPDSVTSIGQAAFRDCSVLRSVIIPDNVTSIGYHAFAYCRALTSVTVGGSVASIGDRAFDSCSGLTNVTFNGTCPSVGSSPYLSSPSVTTYVYSANAANWDTKVQNGPIASGNATWQGQPIRLAEGSGTPSTTLTVGTSSLSLGVGGESLAFSVYGNVSWTATDNADWLTVSPASGSGNGTVTVTATANTGTSSRSATVTVTGGGITRTVAVTQSGTTTSAITTLQNGIPVSGISGGSGSLTHYKITVPSDASQLVVKTTGGSGDVDLYVKRGSQPTTSSYDSRGYTGGNNETLTFSNPASGDWYIALHGYSAYSGVTLTATYSAYSGPTLTVNPSALSLGSGAASQTLSISGNVSWAATDNADWLTVSPASGDGNGTVTVTATANTGASSRSATVTVSGGGITRTVAVTQVDASHTGTWTFNGSNRLIHSDGIWELNVSRSGSDLTVTGVTSPSSSTFAALPLDDVINGDYRITAIGNNAFRDRTGLIGALAIPDSVVSIGTYAFYECGGLTSVIIGDSVVNIDRSAFDHCHGLTSVIIGNSVASIGYGTFGECYYLTSVIIPASLTSIGDVVFWYCTGLTNVVFEGGYPFVDATRIFAGANNATIYIRNDHAASWNPNVQNGPVENGNATWHGRPIRLAEGTVPVPQQVATPIISPADGTVFDTANRRITISCATDGAEIRLTTDGSEPGASTTLYTSSFNISATTTIKTRAFKPGMGDSELTVATIMRAGPAPALADALDVPEWTVTTGGDTPWSAQSDVSHDGADAARTGSIGFMESTWMQTTIEGEGTLAFWWRASCEDDPDYDDWDYLAFYADGMERARIDGDSGWQLVTVTLSAGTHTLRWEYTKDDYDEDVHEDCGWVDQVVWTPAGSDPSPQPVRDWLEKYGLVAPGGDYAAAAQEDSDHDNHTAWEEYVAGTCPTNIASVFRASVAMSNGVMRVTWDPDLDTARAYTVEGKTNLTDRAWHSPTNSASRFFRVRVELP